MTDAILAAFKSYTPDDLEHKTLPDLARLFVKAQRVLTQHPQPVIAWQNPNANPEAGNDPSMAREFER